MGEKAASPCNKFQANIFNKSKCQNCFKSRELHLLTDHGMEQAKPIYAGWLCLAPVGTDFDNPMQRSRKWQRRFFIMYEDGSLSFALDELPSTLPQGTVNMNQCTDIADAEPRTGQRNALCIATPEQEIFIRGDNKEIINGWSEQLAVYLRTNKQNQKKKRKVEPVATQEPSPAKMAATDPSFPASQNNSESGLCRTRWQEDQQQGRAPGETPMWTVPDSLPPGPEKTPAGNTSSYLSPASLDLVTSGNTDRNDQLAEPNNNQNRDESPAERLLGLEATEKEQEVGTAVSRTGRSDNRRELSAPPPQRRAKSLDRRTSDTIMTPDLLNFKKGWMVKLDGDEKWKKYWFVLSTDSLRFYKDSIAEEASDLEGEIDLTKCYNVSEYQVHRNYGFQIHTPKGVFTLSAMTSGIRKNWIQALMKNVRPANAPDVASLPGHHGPCSPPEVLPRPDVTQDSTDVSTDPKHRTVTERRREGRYKTFDWAEFRPPNKQRTKAPSCLELGDLERRRRREERRRRYESMLGFPLGWEVVGGQTAGGSVRSLSPKSQQKVEEDMEECWRQVEKTAFRMDRSVSLLPEAKDSEVEKLLDGYKTGVEDLKVQLVESERLRLELEAQLRTAGFYQQQLDPPLSSDINENPLISLEPQAPSIWLHDTEGNYQELEHLPPETEITPLLLSPASESSFPQSDGQTVDLNVATINRKNQQDPSAETQINPCEYSSLILGEPAEQDDSLSCCVDQHGAPDQEVVRRLSQEVELLASQNEALNQRNQEMLNQLTEADREIERLKVELSSRYTEPHLLPEVEQQGQTRVEDLEQELSSRDQQLLEAQTLISSLEENLREMEALLQLNVATETEEQENKGYLLRCFEATEAKLTELERQLDQSELSCVELRTLNAELKEAEKRHRQTAAEAEANARRLSEELEKERLKDGGSNGCVSGEGRIRQVIDGMVVRLKALEKLLEVIEKLDFGWREEETVESQLRWEEEFWSLLLDRLKVKPSELNEEKPDEELLSEVTERMMVEKQMLLLGRRLLSETSTDEGREGLKDLHVTWNIESETETETTGERRFDFNKLCEMRHFRAVTQVKISFLNRLASSVGSSACDKLQLITDFHFSEHPWSGFIHSAATEALLCCHLSRLQAEYKRQLEETKQISSVVCSNCVNMREENRELRARLLNVEEKSTDVESHLQDADEENEAGSDADHLNSERERVSELRRRVEELEEKLGVMAEEMKEELDGKMSSVQMQHEKEMEKLKVTCERGFASMEASHLKVEEELRRRHQQEVERLLVERDRLLEEESTATATAIEAIKNAHRVELEREVQKRWRSESSAGNTHLDDVYRQHSEELASFQRELQVLSQQFSLKCLENGHLVQALDAERKALCQCQQENQDLRTRNQELSGHLAAEITRLCSLAKQDALPLSQGMDVYEMEITLRVKESEVQCLKQEITSLRDDLQSALRDKRNATKKYKDMYTELSITRAKTERDMDELRENLRLAHHALHQTAL